MSVTDASSCSVNDGSVTATVSGGTATYTYSWSNGQVNSTATGLAQGNYTLTVIDTQSCTNTFSATVGCATGAIELPLQNEFTIYPNPANEVFNLQMSRLENLQIKIYNVLGECIYQYIGTPDRPAGGSANLRIDLSGTQSGIYPNPSNGRFNLQMSKSENVQIKIYDVIGECIYQHIGTSANQQIDLSAAKNGIYFLQLKTEQGVATKKLVIS